MDGRILHAAIAAQREAVADGLSFAAAAQMLADRTRELTGAFAAAVSVLEGDVLVRQALSGPARVPERVDPRGTITGRALATGEAMLCVDAVADERADKGLADQVGVRAMIAVPLTRGELQGVLMVFGREPGAFDSGDVAAVELLALVVTAALGHALEVRALTRLRVIAETQRDIASAGLELGGVMRLIAERSMALTCAEGAMVSLLDGDELVVGAACGVAAPARDSRRRVEDSIAAHAFAARDTLLIERAEADPRLNSAMRAMVRDTSHICVPLFAGDRPVGTLNVMTQSPVVRLGEQDRETLEVLAVVLSAAVSRAAEFEAKRQQIEALARFEATYAGALVGMMLVSREARILDANPAMHELLGVPEGSLVGLQCADLVPAEDVDELRPHFDALLHGKSESFTAEHRFTRGDGGTVWVAASLSIVPHRVGLESFAVAMYQDVTQRREAETALLAQAELNEHQALHDALTGLANRTLFADRIEQALRAARRSGGRGALLMMDLDRFKEVNDSLGHAAGDELLLEVARRLGTVVRDSDTVARLGGDEFALLLPDVGVPQDVVAVVERVLTAMEEPISVHELPLSVEGSIGIALFPGDGADADTLLRRADAAMYQAKEEKLGWAFFAGEAEHKDPTRLTLVGELRRAIEERELTLHYQPQAVLASGEVHSVEALLRWRHPVRGMVPPDEFIPIAQQTGLIKPLTLYVVDEALGQCAAWLERGLPLAVAVNLSARNLLDADFPTQVRDLLRRRELPGEMLVFEITESTMVSDPVRTRVVLEELAAMGIRLSIDDFGTGYSSLAYLKRLPVAQIKIDRSFVMTMDTDEDDATIVRSTIELGRNLGLEVVAEGVETEATLDRLRALGCTLAQGYHLSRPVPAEELEAWLERRRRAPEYPGPLWTATA
jgi:diguanylate cyclase (GGDEF)-like protein/PAS domain S-box-containing protein